MKKVLLFLSIVFFSCKKSNNSQSTIGPNGTPNPIGVATTNHMNSGNCGTESPSNVIALSGNTFYVDSGYVMADGIVAAISGSPIMEFTSDSTYRVTQDSSDYFYNYLSEQNIYHIAGGDTVYFPSYYSDLGFSYANPYVCTGRDTLCEKTIVYHLIQYTEFGDTYNILVLYRNL